MHYKGQLSIIKNSYYKLEFCANVKNSSVNSILFPFGNVPLSGLNTPTTLDKVPSTLSKYPLPVCESPNVII